MPFARRLALAASLCLTTLAYASAAAPPALPGWMAGSWGGTSAGVEMLEVWTPQGGDSMLGMHRDVRDGRTIEFEFLRIEATTDGVTYWASPGGRAATPFRAVEQSDRRVVFSNPKHAYPTRILYWLDQDGALHARIEGTQGGKPAAEEWSWQRR
jgi:Domain of unknown function (DUF6265)